MFLEFVSHTSWTAKIHNMSSMYSYLLVQVYRFQTVTWFDTSEWAVCCISLRWEMYSALNYICSILFLDWHCAAYTMYFKYGYFSWTIKKGCILYSDLWKFLTEDKNCKCTHFIINCLTYSFVFEVSKVLNICMSNICFFHLLYL